MKMKHNFKNRLDTEKVLVSVSQTIFLFTGAEDYFDIAADLLR